MKKFILILLAVPFIYFIVADINNWHNGVPNLLVEASPFVLFIIFSVAIRIFGSEDSYEILSLEEQQANYERHCETIKYLDQPSFEEDIRNAGLEGNVYTIE